MQQTAYQKSVSSIVINSNINNKFNSNINSINI